MPLRGLCFSNPKLMQLLKNESRKSKTNTWVTPKHITLNLGPFDMDVASFIDHPWPIASDSICFPRRDGLKENWAGRVWCNPPYTNKLCVAFMRKMAEYGNGIALVYARTETKWFQKYVFGKASAILFLGQRVKFHHADGTLPKHPSGPPSVLVAYGSENVSILKNCGLRGKFIRL